MEKFYPSWSAYRTICRVKLAIVTLALVGWSQLGPLLAEGYDERRSAAVARCEAIDPSAYQSGLIFNPEGYRSLYLRSECLQKAAVEFRDESLCRQVRRRWSLFSSSWGYSSTQCRKEVRSGLAADEKALKAIKAGYVGGPITLRDFHIERDGNGHDFDIIPTFGPGYAYVYLLTFEILRDDGPPVLLYSDTHYVDGHSDMRLFARQSDVRARYPALAMEHPYTVRETVTLTFGGSAASNWSDAFIERVFPRRERTASVTKNGALVVHDVILSRPRGRVVDPRRGDN